MNDIPGLNFLPEKWRGWVLIAIALHPYLTRIYHTLAGGGGLKGVVGAIWLGTNVPKGGTGVTPVVLLVSRNTAHDETISAANSDNQTKTP